MAMGRCQGAVQVGLRDASLHRESFWPGHRHIRLEVVDASSSRGQALRGKNGWGALGLGGWRFSNAPTEGRVRMTFNTGGEGDGFPPPSSRGQALREN